MTKLITLKSSKSLSEVASILGYKASNLSYILYYLPDSSKYYEFVIPKKNGGTRRISAPTVHLKQIQKKLSDLLQDCVSEINLANPARSPISHGFKRNLSIITNAKEHKNRRYVFNVDIEDFFGSINFGRIFGFFLKDKHFNLDKRVAATLSKIACNKDVLPQGSPCSPVISNLIAHILDIHLVRLAKKYGCIYTRYADDLTFSTNNPIFPNEIARISPHHNHEWIPGKQLEHIIKKSGFKINNSKTRMQYRDSRQDVTGLIVNRKVNVRSEYRRTVRAMVHRLFTSGSFDFEKKKIDPFGVGSVLKIPGNVNQLHGMLAFIDSIDVYNKKIYELNNIGIDNKKLTSKETMYRRFLMFKEFYSAQKPTIICEGNTDNIYLTHALRNLAIKYPTLVVDAELKLKVRLFKYTNTSTGRILKMNGGYSDLAKFIRDYSKEIVRFKAPGKLHPVIVLYDNDSAASHINKAIKDSSSTRKITGTEPYFHITGNLYAMPTPLIGKAESCIEDFFSPATLAKKVEGKTFDPNKDADRNNTYDKVVFAHKVIAAEANSIDFSGFEPLLNNISSLIFDHIKLISSL